MENNATRQPTRKKPGFFDFLKRDDYDFDQLENELLANKPKPTANQENESFRESALALMEKYGFEETHAPGWSEDGFNFIKPIGGDEESRRGFDGWEAIKDYFEEVDKLVENYTQEQLQNRLNGDLSLIDYGVVNDSQLQLAINTKTKDQERLTDQVPHREENTPDQNNSSQDISKQEQMQQLLKDGVKKVMDSENFANWCETQGRLFSNHYSFRNSLLVYAQNPDASYVCGYEQWKDFGRQVKKGAKSIKIYSPVMAKDTNGKGSLFSYIRKQCNEQLKDPSKEYASYRVGKIDFIMYKNGRLFDVKNNKNGKTIGASLTADQTKKFIDQYVIGKEPFYYNVQNVFDIKDTVVTDTLWISKYKAKKEELILNENGQPITDSRGNVKIKNTEERQARFNTNLDADITENDPAKMAILYDVIKTISENKQVPFDEVPRDSDPILASGANGYYRLGQQAGEPGTITISADLTPTQKVRTSLHEFAHSDLHQDLKKLAEDIGIDQPEITRQMKEVQAEAVAYMTASAFRIKTDHKSFSYIASWSDGRELQALEKSLSVIYKESQRMLKEIESELDKRGLDMDLNVKKQTSLTNAEKQLVITANKEFVLNSLQDNEDMKKSALETLSHSDERTQGIVKDQILIMKQIDDTLSNMNNSIDLFEKSESRQQQTELNYLINSNRTQVEILQKQLDDLSSQMVTALREDIKNEIKDLYATDPKRAIAAMKNEQPVMENLDENDIKYLATSKFIKTEYGKFVGTDNQKFATLSMAQLDNLKKVMSKNLTAVEIGFCEQWGDNPIFEKGAVLHPKEANRIVAGAEKQLQELKKQAEEAGDYYPYAKCDLTIYSLSEKGNLSALNTRIDIGDGSQKDIIDHLDQIVKRGKERIEVVDHFKESMKDRPQIKVLTPENDRELSAGLEQSKFSSREDEKRSATQEKEVWEKNMNKSVDDAISDNREDFHKEQETEKEQQI